MQLKSTMTASSVLFVASALCACNPMAVSMAPKQQAATSTGSAPPTPVVAAANYTCLDNVADFEIRTSVTDFELTGGGGLNLQLNIPNLPISGIALGFNYTGGKLDMTMSLWQPLNPSIYIVEAPGLGTTANFKISAAVFAVIASVGLSFNSSTPLSDLTDQALTDNMTNLTTALAQIQLPSWWTHITQMDNQTGFYIPVGSTGGVLVGDQFNVMDASYIFSGGSACVGTLQMQRMNSTTPIATGTVTQVSTTSAYVKITSATGPLAAYNYVTYGKLAQGRTSLPYSLRVGPIATPLIPFSTGTNSVTNVDLTPYLTSQLQTLLPASYKDQFYMHN